MLRTALQPRWLALLAVLLVVLISFGQLGMWQISRAQDEDNRDLGAQQANLASQPLTDVLQPHQAFPDDGSNLPVQATGSYVADLQFLVPQRRLNDVEGYWVITPLRTQSGALLPVLRGWVAQPEDAGAPEEITRTVSGTLAPAESPVSNAGLPPGQRGSVDLANLVNEWPGELYNAFIFATDEQPPSTAGSVVLVPPPTLGSDGLDWSNVGYAMQWWVFAAFAVYMYWRFLRDATYPPVTRGAPAPSSVTS
ncbi:MAG: SURF1 family protein [Ornithinimicrobium sp.]